jgi:hypothetical protein
MQIRRTISKADITELVKHIPVETKQEITTVEDNPHGLDLSYIKVPAEYNSWSEKEQNDFLLKRWQAKMDNMNRLFALGFTLEMRRDGQRNIWHDPNDNICNPIPEDEPLPI